ncbi:MAG: YdjY domain-containing protein [Desulfitobacteriaceae bacterium]
MEMGQRILTTLLGSILIVSLAGCGASQPSQAKAVAPATEQAAQVSKTNPIIVDKVAKTVKMYTEVNGKYFVEPTRHGIVFKDGSNGEKSILKGWGNQNDFYNALIDIGAKPGNNLTLETVAAVQGDPLDVTITWNGAGKAIPLYDAILDSQNKKADFRFGGNQAQAKTKNTGCILCLDSCPVGITSDATYPQKSFDSKQVEFRGNKAVLPADGTPVIVTFKVK